MITWQLESEEHNVINLPLRLASTNIEVTLTLSSDEALENVFLYTTSDFEDSIWAKKSTDSTYLALGTYTTTPTCFLGNLGAGAEINIDFRLNFTTSFLGEQVVPILVGHGSEITSFSYPDTNIFWRDDSTDDPFFWYDSSEEVEADQWHSEV